MSGVERVSAEFAPTKQSLAGYGTAQWAGPVAYWDQNNYAVPVCYLANVDNNGDDAEYFDAFIAALAEVEAVAGLAIHWNGPCAAISPAELPVYVTVVFNDRISGGSTAPGFGKRRTSSKYPGPFQVGIGTTSAFQRISVHEFLHALGFLHEQQRADSEATCPDALEVNANNTTEPGADRLTPYDDESIMNYCREDGSGKLTYFDRVGLSVLYPKTYVRRVYGDFAFPTADGLLSRSQGNLLVDWIREGALDSVIEQATWEVDGQVAATGVRFSMSGRSSGSFALSGGFTDFMGREHSIASTTLTINNAKHTALLMAVSMSQ